nr:hypothetical protein Iba_scaffold103CG0040 [Ipomoea batatas]GME08356.1 hypothetical protein Iba_scaffold7505CG0010 [Ipomoea batatas]
MTTLGLLATRIFRDQDIAEPFSGHFPGTNRGRNWCEHTSTPAQPTLTESVLCRIEEASEKTPHSGSPTPIVRVGKNTLRLNFGKLDSFSAEHGPLIWGSFNFNIGLLIPITQISFLSLFSTKTAAGISAGGVPGMFGMTMYIEDVEAGPG